MLPALLAVVAATAALLPALAAAQSCPLAPLIRCGTPDRAGGPGAGETPATAPKRMPAPLEIGLTEGDPRLLLPSGVTRGVARKVVALKPNYVRVLVPWERLQPYAARKPNWDAPPTGCPRINPGCRSLLGLRTVLRLIRHRQRADGGWRILAVPYFTPPWAASRYKGCQKKRSRHPRTQLPRIAPYRRFLRGLNALADKVGVKIDYITPWNEPNHPGFLQPQRANCNRRSRAVSPAAYAKLARAARQELRYEQTLVLGSLAGLQQPRVYGAGAAEFIRGLPRDVACLDGPFAQHAYIGRPGRRGREPRRANPASAARRNLLDDVLAALDAKGCARSKQLWIAETGTFDHRCEAMSAALRSWARNDRIDAAFQYTFRESRAFPVGLVSPSMMRTYASYRAWLAFAGGPAKAPPNPC
ncbi:MAG: hypothetical protein ACLGI5_00090 [Thermoleophilia bacterium]